MGGDKDQAIGIELVKRGYIVFAPDAIGFGERRSPDSDRRHLRSGLQFSPVGAAAAARETLLKKILWDVSKGLDYLETRTD